MTLNMPVDKQSALYQQNQIKTARNNLLVVVLFTVLNMVLLLIGSNRYFLFSATIPYYLIFFGYTFDYFTLGAYTLTGLVMALVPLIGLGLCWFMCKKDNRWMTAAAVLFGIDTVAMAALMLWAGDLSGSFLDIVFHGWVLVTLIAGIKAANRLKVMDTQMVAEPDAPVADPWATTAAEEVEEELSETITVETEPGETDTDCSV